jgi:hypothetical protein
MQSASDFFSDDNPNNAMKCSVPTSITDVRRIYIDGRFSINNNLPRPICSMMKSHSYVSIKDSLADFFGHGKHRFLSISEIDCTAVNDVNSLVTNLFECRKGRSILDRCRHSIIDHEKQRLSSFPVIPVFLLFWSDDFEPNNSIKSNRQSVWIKTVTFVFKSPSFSDVPVCCLKYPVAV